MEKIGNYIEVLELLLEELDESCRSKVQQYLESLKKERNARIREQIRLQ